MSNQAKKPAAPPAPPEEIVDDLRAVRERMGELTPLTPRQRKTALNRARGSNEILLASINVIGALDHIAQAVGQPAADVRKMIAEANRWTAVEDELRSMLAGVSGANLLRRVRIAQLAIQATTIGSVLARDPAHAVLVPHVQEVRRLKRIARRKKGAPNAETPAQPAPDGTEADGGSTGDK